MKRLAVLISVVALWSMAFAAPVLAAPPSNDTYAGRTTVGQPLPFSASLDTSQATSDADDVDINNIGCGAPAIEASVWYEFIATADATILIDVSASDYSAGVFVGTGSPGSFVGVACLPSGVAFAAESGETYTILAFDDQTDGSGNGGTLEITIDAAPPPPTVDITINGVGQFNKVTGSATISGTLTCTGDAVYSEIQVRLSQNVGRFTISGFGGILVEPPVCDGTAQPWSVEVFGSTGKFKGGRAVAVTSAFVCDTFTCSSGEEQSIVKLR
jgi:hypothetical protein